MIIEDLSPASAACSRYLKPFIRFPALSCQQHKHVRIQLHKPNIKPAKQKKSACYLQFHIWQYVMRQLQIALSQSHDGLQLATQCSSLQVEHGRVLIPLLILLTEPTRFMVPHHRQVDLGGRKETQDIFNWWNKVTMKTSFFCSNIRIVLAAKERHTSWLRWCRQELKIICCSSLSFWLFVTSFLSLYCVFTL